MASDITVGVQTQVARRVVSPNSQPGLRRNRQVKDGQYRETLQTTGRTTRMFNRPKRVCVDHQSVTSVTRDGARRECARYPASQGPCNGAFLRHDGIFRPDVVSRQNQNQSQSQNRQHLRVGVPPPVGRHPSLSKRTRRKERALPIVHDEFRPAIPRSGWSPPEPVSASPAHAD